MNQQFNNKCRHNHQKKNWPFGRKSKPFIQCLDCGKVITMFEIKKLKQNSRKKRI
jgi:hypothetical protein